MPDVQPQQLGQGQMTKTLAQQSMEGQLFKFGKLSLDEQQLNSIHGRFLCLNFIVIR